VTDDDAGIAARLTRIERKLDRLHWLTALAAALGTAAVADYAIRHSAVPAPGFWGPIAFGVTLVIVGAYFEWNYRRR
jgi:hypothetical protein